MDEDSSGGESPLILEDLNTTNNTQFIGRRRKSPHEEHRKYNFFFIMNLKENRAKP